MQKTQSILEYLIVLTAIVIIIFIHTFGPAGVRAGVNRALDKQHQTLEEIMNRDYSGVPINQNTIAVH